MMTAADREVLAEIRGLLNRRKYISNLIWNDYPAMTPMFQIDFGNNDPERVVGIDLGTTNSLVAYMDLTAARSHPRRGWRQAGSQRRFACAAAAKSSSATRRAGC